MIKYSSLSKLEITNIFHKFKENPLPSATWEKGKFHKIEEMRTLFACKQDPKKKLVHYIAEDPEYFLLLEADKSRLGWAKILMKAKL